MDVNNDILTHLSRQNQVHADLIRAMAQKIGELQLSIGQLYYLLNQKNPDTVDVEGTSSPVLDVRASGGNSAEDKT